MVVEARPWLENVAGRYPYEYALVDVETTGLNPATDRIIQVAVAHVSSHGVLQRTWSTLIDPECDPGPLAIHGLTREHLNRVLNRHFDSDPVNAKIDAFVEAVEAQVLREANAA